MSEEEQVTDFEQNESSQVSNNIQTKTKQVTDFKQFIIKYSFISSILMWTLSDRAQNLIRLGIDAFVDPIFAIDLNNDGTKDNVYWLTGNSGILVYDVSENDSLFADTLTMKDNIFSEYFELDINNDGRRRTHQ